MEETDFVMIEDVHTRPAQRDDALSNVLHIFEPKIKLDVGGHIFATTIATLTRFPDSMLGTVFSGHALTTEEAGTFFFDRDGTLFRYILNYLRSPDSWDNSDFHGRQLMELMNEAEYYGLKDLMFPPTPPPPPFVPAEPVIKLDVGGHIFATTIATLTRFPDSMLGTVFSGHALTTEEAGTFFFDRDGTLFRYILNYLRSPDSWDNSDFHGRQLMELMNEAEYYGLKDLMFPPTPPPPPFVPAEPVTVSSHDGSDITITQGDDQLWYMQNESIGSKVVKVCENCGLGWPTGCGHLHRVANFK